MPSKNENSFALTITVMGALGVIVGAQQIIHGLSNGHAADRVGASMAIFLVPVGILVYGIHLLRSFNQPSQPLMSSRSYNDRNQFLTPSKARWHIQRLCMQATNTDPAECSLVRCIHTQFDESSRALPPIRSQWFFAWCVRKAITSAEFPKVVTEQAHLAVGQHIEWLVERITENLDEDEQEVRKEKLLKEIDQVFVMLDDAANLAADSQLGVPLVRYLDIS